MTWLRRIQRETSRGISPADRKNPHGDRSHDVYWPVLHTARSIVPIVCARMQIFGGKSGTWERRCGGKTKQTVASKRAETSTNSVLQLYRTH